MAEMRSAILLVCLMLAGCEEPRPPAGVDLSTPKPVAVAFLKAIQLGKANDAVALSTGTPEQRRWVRALATMVGGMRAFDNAMYAQFGHMVDQVHLDMGDSLRILADQAVVDISEGQLEANEDQARIDPKKHGYVSREVPSIFLRKIKDEWRVDIGPTYAADAPPDKMGDVSAAFEQYQKVGQVFAAAAADVNARRYKSTDEAVRGLAERLKALSQPQD